LLGKYERNKYIRTNTQRKPSKSLFLHHYFYFDSKTLEKPAKGKVFISTNHWFVCFLFSRMASSETREGPGLQGAPGRQLLGRGQKSRIDDAGFVLSIAFSQIALYSNKFCIFYIRFYLQFTAGYVV
jgi:hypothetical protein